MRGRGQVVRHLDEGQLNAVALEDGRRLNGDGVDAEMEVLVAVRFATGSALVFYVQQLPLQHLCEFDLLGGTAMHQYCEQIKDTTIL